MIENYSKKFTVVKSSEESNEVKVKRIQCNVCNKIIIKKHARDHYVLHDPTLPNYVCDICGKAFRQRSACVRHKNTHSTEFKFKCNLCPYRGNTSDLLRTHTKRHEGNYQYLCTKYPAKFLTKSNFNKHSVSTKILELNVTTVKNYFV